MGIMPSIFVVFESVSWYKTSAIQVLNEFHTTASSGVTASTAHAYSTELSQD